ncbi:MAG: hypothetical protein VKJ24_07020 [Synechococcales bacterium]|nr:hypothetical protein [Synechococcales bacterium]
MGRFRAFGQRRLGQRELERSGLERWSHITPFKHFSTGISTAIRVGLLSLPCSLLGGVLAFSTPVSAQADRPAPSSASPAPLSNSLMAQLDRAVNRQDLPAALQLFSANFSHSDGLTRQSLETALTQLWKQYPNLTYRTEVTQSKMTAAGITALETVTHITGQRVTTEGQEWSIAGTIKATQHLQNDKILRQEILSEKISLSLGERPPTVKLAMPDAVGIAQSYNFEAIVQEPVGEDLLMGAILEETVNPALVVNPDRLRIEFPSVAELLTDRELIRPPKLPPQTKRLKLKRLRAGGFFKIGRSANVPETRWITAVLARHDAGMTIVTQRLRTTGKSEHRGKTAFIPNF